MERRAFCRFLGACALSATCGGLAGCARLLDNSRTTSTESRTDGSGPATATGKAADGADAPGPFPDLVAYQGEDPGANVRAALTAMGGMKRFVKRDGLVVVKPNVMTAQAPEFGTTTNPQVVSAIVAMCLEAGARKVVVLDRPVTEPRPAFDVSGITRAVESAGGSIKILDRRNFEIVDMPLGRALTSWPLCTDVFEADTFINVPIAKTHDMAGLTMSMKNLMGIMHGDRGTMHQDFNQKIVDVNAVVKPHLVVLDAYRIMVRNGPTGGNLSDLESPKTVIVGTSQVAVDAMGSTLFGWEPERLEYLRLASEQGLGVIDLGSLRVERGQA